MIRLFAAIAIPEEIGESLARRQQGLPGAKWRSLASLHLTLRFFGEVSEDMADDIDAELAQVRGRPFDLKLGGAGAFATADESRAAKSTGMQSATCTAHTVPVRRAMTASAGAPLASPGASRSATRVP
jgi:2'-5' RNA ligase